MIRNWLYRLMAGRYGSDNLNKFLLILAIIPLIISFFFKSTVSSILWFVALAILIYSYFRMFSKNIYKRRIENIKYLNVKHKIISWFRNCRNQFKMRKDYKFFKCPSCKSNLRVPRGKGKIKVTCRKCGHVFNTKT